MNSFIFFKGSLSMSYHTLSEFIDRAPIKTFFLFSKKISKPIHTAVCKIKRYSALKTINFHIITGPNQGVNFFFFDFCHFVIFITSSNILNRKRNTEKKYTKIMGECKTCALPTKFNKVSSNNRQLLK